MTTDEMRVVGGRLASGGRTSGLPSGPGASLRGLLARPLTSYYLLLASVGLLVLIGLAMVFSATSLSAYVANGNAFASVIKQAASAVVGVVGFWFCQRLPVRTFRAVGKWILIAAFATIGLVDLLGFVGSMRGRTVHIGPVYASELWLHVGSVQLQPAEIAKLGLVLWGAQLLAAKGKAIASWRGLALPLFPVAGAMFIMVGYNDLGSMICLVLLFVGLLWAAGVRFRVFGALLGVGLAGITALVLAPDKIAYRMARVTVFLDPASANKSDEAYQYYQGLYALADGGWFGVGLGEGRLKWGRLPNGHNDSIFALIAEELGVIGCIVVLGLFAVLAYTGLRIARRVPDPFRRMVAASITTWFVGQAMINIGGVVGLLPITGLPLPFISDGGTALVMALAAAGILTSFARAEPDAARALHARPPRRWVRLLWAPLPPMPRSAGQERSRSTSGRSSG